MCVWGGGLLVVMFVGGSFPPINRLELGAGVEGRGGWRLLFFSH